MDDNKALKLIALVIGTSRQGRISGDYLEYVAKKIEEIDFKLDEKCEDILNRLRDQLNK